MRNLYVLISVILLNQFIGNAQDFNIDTISMESNNQLISWNHVSKRIGLADIEKSNQQFELRMFCKQAITNSGYFNVVYLTDSVFKGIKGDFKVVYSKNYKKIKRVRITNKERYEVKNNSKFVNELLGNNLTMLPNQNEIKDKMKIISFDANGEEVVEMVMVCDGASYDFEIKIKENIRFMNYSNPCTYLEHYKDVKELQNICGILKLMNEE